MSSNNPPKSLKELRDRAVQSSFVGREAQLQQFRSVIATPYSERDRFIFNISGQGGIGKTTLLEQFQQVAKELGYVTAYVDEGPTTNPIDDGCDLILMFNQLSVRVDKRLGKWKCRAHECSYR